MTSTPTYMPHLFPGEHLLGALNRAKYRGAIKDWRQLGAGAALDSSTITPNYVLRPLYSAVSQQFNSLTTAELMTENTLWPYFRSFMPERPLHPPCEDEWITSYNSRNVLVPNVDIRIKHARQWRWCLHCAQSDRERYGTSYWHVEHQLPGLKHCPEHSDSPLLGSCEECGSQVDTLNPSIRLHRAPQCPQCNERINSAKVLPEHPAIDWIASVSIQLQSGEYMFNWPKAKTDIFKAIGFIPQSRSSVARNKAISKARKKLSHGLPLTIRNWFFQSKYGESYNESEEISALCLRQLYKESTFVHPLSCMLMTWILLNETQDLSQYMEKLEPL